MQMQMQMQMQTFGLLCVHVHTYAHTPWLLRQIFLHHPVVCSAVSGHLVYRAHTPDMFRPQSYLMFGIELKESN